MLIPTGFWSYTTSDDTSSRGKLSQLRALLTAELQQQVGRDPKVNIFQDVAAIPPGTEWERQIRQAIAESSFLIPIVTPGFLQSEWCCQEVGLFREREAKLGVRDLVFPIHYVDTEHVDGANPHQCHDPSVLAFLRTRQWIDFRHLRFRSQESEDVSLALETLARGVLRALRAGGPAQQRAEEQRHRDIEEARRAEEVRRRGNIVLEARLERAEAPNDPPALRHDPVDTDTSGRGTERAPANPADSGPRATLAASQSRPTVRGTTAIAGIVLFAVLLLALGSRLGTREMPPPSRSIPPSGPAAKLAPAGDTSVADTAPPNGPQETPRPSAVTPPDPSTQLAGLEQSATDGDADAMGKLGDAFYFGRGVSQDYVQARHWYEKAAAAGRADAMLSLGLLYANGQGVPQDYAKAHAWYEKAAAAGRPDALFNLGVLYENGQGVAKDYAKARELFVRAAAAGDANAMRSLAALIESGLGGPKDEDEAYQWRLKAFTASTH